VLRDFGRKSDWKNENSKLFELTDGFSGAKRSAASLKISVAIEQSKDSSWWRLQKQK